LTTRRALCYQCPDFGRLAQLGERLVYTQKASGSSPLPPKIKYFKEALFQEDIQSDPTAGIGNIKEHRRPPDTFSLQELQLLFPIESLGPWEDLEDNSCFLIAAATGMRRCEILALRWEQIHVNDGYILVDRAWKDAQTEGKPKWEHVRTARIVLFRVRVKQRLDELKEKFVYIGPTDYVLCDAAGNPRGFTWGKKHFAKAMGNFNPDAERKLSPHVLRHSLATILRINGQDPAFIRASLGWYQERTQQRYEHIGAEHLVAMDIS
jgi:integrase